MTSLTLHRTAPQQERRAVAEARRAGVKAYVPQETRTRKVSAHTKRTTTYSVPLAPGYITLTGHVYEAQHIGKVIGRMPKSELQRLYDSARQAQLALRKAKRASAEPIRFTPGEPVSASLHGTTITGKVVSQSGRVVRIEANGKLLTISAYHLHRPPQR